MKFGIYLGLNQALKRYEPKEALSRIKRMGFDTIEPLYSAGIYTEALLPHLKEAMEKFSLPMPCYSLCADLLREEDLQKAKMVADQAAFLGCRYLHHTLIPSLTPQALEKEEVERVILRLKESCRYAEQKGLTLLVEPQGMVFNGVKGLQGLFEAMEGENLFYCSDVGNGIFVDEDPLTLAKAFLGRTRHVHVKDYRYVAEGGTYQSLSQRHFEEVIPGDGDLPLRKFLDLYREEELCISIEYSGPWEEQEDALCRVKALTEA